MAAMEDTMPRAKRLKMLREAKDRKERIERGEAVEKIGAGVESVSIDKSNERDASEDADDQEAKSDEFAAAVIIEQPQVKEHEAEEEDEDDNELLNLAPKRANWDIERDIAPMLKKLEKRTQYAIVEILRACHSIQLRLHSHSIMYGTQGTHVELRYRYSYVFIYLCRREAGGRARGGRR